MARFGIGDGDEVGFTGTERGSQRLFEGFTVGFHLGNWCQFIHPWQQFRGLQERIELFEHFHIETRTARPCPEGVFLHHFARQKIFEPLRGARIDLRENALAQRFAGSQLLHQCFPVHDVTHVETLV